jgi:hypothetical protein
MQCPHCREEIADELLAHHLAAKGGASKSEAKRLASARNGRLGGRPKRSVTPKQSGGLTDLELIESYREKCLS